MPRYESIFFFRVQYPVRVYREDGGMDIYADSFLSWVVASWPGHFTPVPTVQGAGMWLAFEKKEQIRPSEEFIRDFLVVQHVF
jgi:hypothetical protein